MLCLVMLGLILCASLMIFLILWPLKVMFWVVKWSFDNSVLTFIRFVKIFIVLPSLRMLGYISGLKSRHGIGPGTVRPQQEKDEHDSSTRDVLLVTTSVNVNSSSPMPSKRPQLSKIADVNDQMTTTQINCAENHGIYQHPYLPPGYGNGCRNIISAKYRHYTSKRGIIITTIVSHPVFRVISTVMIF